MTTRKPHLKLVKNEAEIFDAPASYQFIFIGKIKIETVGSFLNRGGAITYIGAFSDQLHATNFPEDEMVMPYDPGPAVALKKAA